MAAAAVASGATTGLIGMWNGTKDGRSDGYVDWSNGVTNVNDPKQLEIEVQDIRTLSPTPSYEKDGYGLVQHQSSLTTEEFLAGSTPEGKAIIEDVYFKEVAELVKKITGSSNVHPYVFRVRQNNQKPGQFTTKKLSHTALPVAHVDRDDVTGENGVREVLGDVADELIAKHKRYAQVNIWRTIGDPIQKWPLCFVNHADVPDWSYKTHMARVFPENDPRIAIRGEKTHDSVLKHDPGYKYHYASNLDVDEALVFSSFDSDMSKVIPHGAFWDNSSSEDAPTRRSIEVRSWVFFD
ncbi:Uu.00g125900.m01.CDS01 [Anthostomella pinea]|uniref:Uu.00g125900.m01.CDS01 n=1 Tax=Anthostomella pinea TaxID=933095 RepID=A0AAI8VIF2_9PEZI|nr:Uu.00g125900.m01.CDS01 [Anthostomella pinea]